MPVPTFVPEPNVKKRGCRNCDKFQYYGADFKPDEVVEPWWGECRRKIPVKCCPAASTPTINNFPQIDLSKATDRNWWCAAWKRTTGTPIPDPGPPGPPPP